MRPKPPQQLSEEKRKSAKEDLSDKDILAPPKDESDSSSSEDIRRAADIKSTRFTKRAPEELKPRPPQGKSRSSKDDKSIGSSTSSNNTSSTKSTNGTRSSKQKLPSVDPASSPGVSIPNKRKNDEDNTKWCTRVDPFGRIVNNPKKPKTAKTTYFLHQSKPMRTQSEAARGMFLAHQLLYCLMRYKSLHRLINSNIPQVSTSIAP